ncbi:MAG: 5-formyltetrahydrofolate cyclo-ligase [Rhodospirillaceae bacterium]|jgi:5-formyltetrahydrofolate cyclo-ligase
MSQSAQGQSQAEKAALRSEMLALRKIVKASHPRASSQLSAQLEQHIKFGPQTVIAGYFAIGDELDPQEALMRLQDRGATLCLPVVGQSGEVLTFKAWRVGQPLDSGRYKTFQPGAHSDELVPSVVLVPVVAFDSAGFRLGFGGGYYDRTLSYLRQSNNIAAYGVAFDEQQVEAIPVEPFDAQLDGVFTPTRFIETDRVGQDLL